MRASEGAVAQVASTVALVTLIDPTKFGEEAAPQDPDTINVSVRLLALLEIGLAVAAKGNPSTVGFARNSVADLGALEEIVLKMARMGSVPSQHRQAQWGGLVDALAEFGIETDAETLLALPIELVAVEAVRDLFAAE
jgi:hypothetical protein